MKILIGNFNKISDTKWQPQHIQMDYENFPVPNYDDLVYVDYIEPKFIGEKHNIMFYNPQTNNIFYEYFDIPKPIDVIVDELKEKIAILQQALDDIILKGGAL